MDSTIIVEIIGAVASIIAVIAVNRKTAVLMAYRMDKLEEKVDKLEDKVGKHNSFEGRLLQAEADIEKNDALNEAEHKRINARLENLEKKGA